MLARLTTRSIARAPALARLPRLQPAALAVGRSRLFSTERQSMEIPEGSAYAILGVSRDVNKQTLQAVYKSLVRRLACPCTLAARSGAMGSQAP
jgi:hypothetical protein